jgi:hypothetical protein
MHPSDAMQDQSQEIVCMHESEARMHGTRIK